MSTVQSNTGSQTVPHGKRRNATDTLASLAQSQNEDMNGDEHSKILSTHPLCQKSSVYFIILLQRLHGSNMSIDTFELIISNFCLSKNSFTLLHIQCILFSSKCVCRPGPVSAWRRWGSLHRFPISRAGLGNGGEMGSKAYITTAIRHDYDEKLTCSFFARVRMEACARDTS